MDKLNTWSRGGSSSTLGASVLYTFPKGTDSPPEGFEWDPAKARTNLTKHGISFMEATLVFSDPRAKTTRDPEHSKGESRELTIGRTGYLHIVIVSHADRDGIVRIISARNATKREIDGYLH